MAESRPGKHEKRGRQILTDEQLRDIIFWRSEEPTTVLAAEFGVDVNTVSAARRRISFRHLRIAAEFGLVKPGPRSAFAPKSDKVVRARPGQLALTRAII